MILWYNNSDFLSLLWYQYYGKQKCEWASWPHAASLTPACDKLSQFLGKSSACHKQVPNSEGRDGSLPRSHSLPSLLTVASWWECLRQKLPCSFSCPPLLSRSFLNCSLLASSSSCSASLNLARMKAMISLASPDLLLIHLDLELLLVGNGDHPVMMFNIRIAQT